jgi:hypothetical protein
MAEGAGFGFEILVDHFVNIGKGMRSIRRKMNDGLEIEVGGSAMSTGQPAMVVPFQTRPGTGRKWLITAIGAFGNDPHTNVGATITPPAVPATTVTQANPYPYAIGVNVIGGTVTVISINGAATGLTSGLVYVPAGGNIAITYSAAPTWTWTEANVTTGDGGILPGTTQAFVDLYAGSEPDSATGIGGMLDIIDSAIPIPAFYTVGHKSLWCHSGHMMYGIAYNIPAGQNIAVLARVRDLPVDSSEETEI